MKITNYFLFKLFDLRKRFNDGWPSIQEVEWSWRKVRFSKLNEKIQYIMFSYLIGQDKISICEEVNITTERLRQMLLKGCRVAREYE